MWTFSIAQYFLFKFKITVQAKYCTSSCSYVISWLEIWLVSFETKSYLLFFGKKQLQKFLLLFVHLHPSAVMAGFGNTFLLKGPFLSKHLSCFPGCYSSHSSAFPLVLSDSHVTYLMYIQNPVLTFSLCSVTTEFLP